LSFPFGNSDFGFIELNYQPRMFAALTKRKDWDLSNGSTKYREQYAVN